MKLLLSNFMKNFYEEASANRLFTVTHVFYFCRSIVRRVHLEVKFVKRSLTFAPSFSISQSTDSISQSTDFISQRDDFITQSTDFISQSTDFISQSLTDFHFAKYRFHFAKYRFHFAKYRFHFFSFRFARYHFAKCNKPWWNTKHESASFSYDFSNELIQIYTLSHIWRVPLKMLYTNN